MTKLIREWWSLPMARRIVLAVFVCAMIHYGATKTRMVSFPRTDPAQAYLVDTGSFVSNDTVHVEFTSYLIPPTAMIYLDCWPDDSTNEQEIVHAFSAPLGDFPNPLHMEYEGADTNRWMCYTTWTPGPVVHTNGVWQTNWMTDRLHGGFIIPIHTTIEANGLIIAPPRYRAGIGGEHNE